MLVYFGGAHIYYDKLRESADGGLRAIVDQLLPHFGDVDVRMRVPLLDMSKASLREMTAAQYSEFKSLFKAIVEADKRLSLFEWMVTNSLVKHLDGHFESVPRKAGAKIKLAACKDELRFLLSALAHAGEAGEEESRRSYEAASRNLGLSLGDLMPRKECRVSRLSNAVARLAQLKLESMKKVLGACVRGIASDGEVSQLEAELLRVFSETMGCPVPPLLPGQKLGVKKGTMNDQGGKVCCDGVLYVASRCRERLWYVGHSGGDIAAGPALPGGRLFLPEAKAVDAERTHVQGQGRLYRTE